MCVRPLHLTAGDQENIDRLRITFALPRTKKTCTFVFVTSTLPIMILFAPKIFQKILLKVRYGKCVSSVRDWSFVAVPSCHFTEEAFAKFHFVVEHSHKRLKLSLISFTKRDDLYIN